MSKCEACGAPGVYREDYDAVLCNSHAELPTYPARHDNSLKGWAWMASYVLIWFAWFLIVWLGIVGSIRVALGGPRDVYPGNKRTEDGQIA